MALMILLKNSTRKGFIWLSLPNEEKIHYLWLISSFLYLDTLTRKSSLKQNFYQKEEKKLHRRTLNNPFLKEN
jgi:hypothetical protein